MMNRVLGALLGVVIGMGAPLQASACEQVLNGLQGASRHDTIARVMQTNVPSVNQGAGSYTILARDDHYQDVLASIPWAVHRHLPIAVTPPDRINLHTREYLLNHRRASTILIVGGTVAIQPQVEQQLRDLGFRVERLAGANRNETMRLIAKRAGFTRGHIAAGAITPREVVGGAISQVTPVGNTDSTAKISMPIEPLSVCYRPGDEVAALYKYSYEIVHTYGEFSEL